MFNAISLDKSVSEAVVAWRRRVTSIPSLGMRYLIFSYPSTGNEATPKENSVESG